MTKLTAMTADGPAGLEPCQLVPAESLLSAAPAEQGAVVFDQDGKTCGLWEATPYAERMEDYPFFELAHILSGAVVITPEGGTPQRFSAGQSYFMEKGFTGRFEVVETCRKAYFVTG